MSLCSTAGPCHRRPGVPTGHRPGSGRHRSRHAAGGDQLPTVRQLAVDPSINPNTVVRAYRELEIRGILTTQQGIGTFVTTQPVPVDEAVRQRQLDQLIGDLLARAGAAGLKADEIVARLQEFINEQRGLS